MWWVILAVVVSVGVSGCQGGRSVVPVRLDAVPAVGPLDPRLLTTHESAVRAIGAMLVRDFGLPLPDELTVYVYGSRRLFEEGLVHDALLSPARAAELSRSALGVGRPRRILFHDVASDHGREWLRLIAHELTHVSQIELAGGERGPAQWLKEGMAEWVAFSVLDRLRVDSLARRREAALAGVRRSVAEGAVPLDLEALGTPAGFSARHRRGGAVPTYQLSFSMVDRLVSRAGFARVVEYFRAFSLSDDGPEHFRRAFGATLGEFEADMRDVLAARG